MLTHWRDLKRIIVMFHMCFPCSDQSNWQQNFLSAVTTFQTRTCMRLTSSWLFTWQQCKWNSSVCWTSHIATFKGKNGMIFFPLHCFYKSAWLWQSEVNAVLGLTITLFLHTFTSPFSTSFTLSLSFLFVLCAVPYSKCLWYMEINDSD